LIELAEPGLSRRNRSKRDSCTAWRFFEEITRRLTPVPRKASWLVVFEALQYAFDGGLECGQVFVHHIPDHRDRGSAAIRTLGRPKPRFVP
jgi:hypothetical protein